jgi:hypothetical protein
MRGHFHNVCSSHEKLYVTAFSDMYIIQSTNHEMRVASMRDERLLTSCNGIVRITHGNVRRTPSVRDK